MDWLTSTGEEVAPLIVSGTTPENQAASFRKPGPRLGGAHHPARRCGAAASTPLPFACEPDLQVRRRPPRHRRLHGPPPHGRAAYPEKRRDSARALRHGQRSAEPLDQLLDGEVDERDACGRRAVRWRDRQPGRSLRSLCAAAVRVGVRGRHDPKCLADVLGRGMARGQRRRRTFRGLSPGPGHVEPAAWLYSGSDVQVAARPPAGRRLQLLDRREQRPCRSGCRRHGPAAGRLLRRAGLGPCRHGGRRALATGVRWRHRDGRARRQRLPPRRGPILAC